MGKTYLVGKIGKSVKFNPSTWGSTGGDCEAPELLRKIAELNPEDTFIIIGRNDVDRNRKELNLPNNLRDVYEGATTEERKDINYIINRLKDVKIDGCFLVSGPIANNCNIPNKAFKRTSLKNGVKEFAKSLYVFENYVGPVYNYLNESNIPWLMIVNDPRYITQGNDLMNHPQKILSQYDEVVTLKKLDNWVDQNYVTTEIQAVYAGMEKMFLIDKVIPKEFNKTCKFMVVLNEGANGVKSRYPMIKEYVLDTMQDVEIYGKWDEETVKGDTRFKGSIKFEELQAKLPHVKYSFMISITDGWVTMKVWELLSHGIIPFMHPNYDTQKHCKLPDFIRLSKPSDLGERIEMLENDPALYEKILKECLDAITEDELSGKFLSDTILSATPAINKVGNSFSEQEINEEGLDEW